jgi:P-type conjugative transfer protein TrbJ
MKRQIYLSLILSASLLYKPLCAQAILGVGDIVFDPAAVAQLIQQVQQTINMINQLKTMGKELASLRNWAIIDHTNLAGGKFASFLSEYKRLFDQVQQEIESYQNGGLMGQIGRLDEVYFPYYEGWDDPEANKEPLEADPLHSALAKQILWTRIQFKHAAKVGAKIRENLPATQEQINVLLDDTAQAVGVMQSIKIGNQLAGVIGKSLQNLNVSLTEQIQAQAAQGLEQNHKQGLQVTRARDAIKNWGEAKPSAGTQGVPKNPFQNY